MAVEIKLAKGKWSLVGALQFACYMSGFLAATFKISVVKFQGFEMKYYLSLGVAATSFIHSF